MSALSDDRWRVVSPYLDRALEMAVEDRAAWLASLRAEDPTLAADVESLLEERSALSRERFLEGAAGRLPEPASLSGQTIGAYTLVSLIGQGGMGSVWLADRSDGRYEGLAAIKLLNASLVGRAGEERFRREGNILARLTHPHIARLVDAGVSSGGQPYLVLEHVEGERIDRYCDSEKLDVEARVRLFLDVLAAVAHAHANLIVHRDIKPSNVLVGRDGQVKLLDFGIAKLLESEAGTGEATALTREGGSALTPEYAAPEQVTGGAITTATDVYALGVLLYVLLTGRHPAGTALSSPADLYKAIVEMEPPRLSDAVVQTKPLTRETLENSAALRTTTPEALRRILKGDLDTIVAKAFKKNPEERYPSVTALADDLTRCLNDEPIGARPDTLTYRTGKFVRRHARAVGAAAGVVLLLAGLTGFYTLRLAKERDRARLEAQKAARMAKIAGEQAQRAEAVRQFLVGVFQRARPDENRGQPISAHQLLEKGEQQVAGSLTDQPALQADVTALLGELYMELSDFPRAESLLARALAASRDARVPTDVRARVLIAMAEIEDENGTYAKAMAHAQEGLGLLRIPAPGSLEAIATAHQVITHGLIGLGNTAVAETRLRETLRQDGAALGDRSEAVGGQWVQLGQVLGDLGRYDESEAAFRKGIGIFRSLYGEESNHVAHALNEMSNMLDDKGDLAGSEDALRQALRIRLATLGPTHHDTLAVEHNLLVVVEYRGRYTEALPARLTLLERFQKAGDLHPLDLAASYTAIGVDYRELGRLREAEGALREALAVIKSSQGPRHPRSTNTLHHLGLVWLLEGRYREAETAFRDALAIQLEHSPPTSPVMAVRRADVGHLLRLQHRYSDAVEQLQQAASVIAQKEARRIVGALRSWPS